MLAKNTVAIVCGGGPAPGMNGVISAVTIAARNNGWNVLGIMDGFTHLAKGEKKVIELTTEMVSKTHLAGGTIIHTARFNPTKNEEHLQNVVKTLLDMGVTHLVTIGGDDTAYSAYTVAGYAKKHANTDLHVVHVPKTIDNDLPLPDGVPTFGFETARHLGAEIATNILEDAKTAQRWFLGIAMGRTAGHLALGIGKCAAAQVTVIPEEFSTKTISLKQIVDIVAGSVIKRLAEGKHFGLAIIAEGVMEKIPEEDLAAAGALEKDEHGHLRYSEINFGSLLKRVVVKRLAELGVKMAFVSKDIGYELRCATPVAYDVEYTRNLGYAAFEFLQNGETDAIITVTNTAVKPLPFCEIIDPVTKKTQVRLVNLAGMQYRFARAFMTRLEKTDFLAENLVSLAAVTNLSPEQFAKEFAELA